jgi:shikimate dehydrogenase
MDITGKTKIMFILADPVAHVVGSAIFNKHFAEAGLNVAISPLHVAPSDLGTAIAAIRIVRNLAGFGVTIPHKIDIRNFIDEETQQAKLVGSVNFVRRMADGRLVGDNVDGAGFVDGLATNGISLSGKRVLQIGAGGAGRSIAFSIAAAGAAALGLCNRTEAKAASLLQAVSAAYPGCETFISDADPRGFDIIVNTTSLGLRESDPLPCNITLLQPEMVVAEIIMTPAMTPLLRAAEQAGCKISLGRSMLEAQIQRVRQFMQLDEATPAAH